MRTIFISVILILASTLVFSQEKINLKFDFIKVSTFLVNSKPTFMDISAEEITDFYFNDYRLSDSLLKLVDSTILYQIVSDYKVDTSNWNTTELQNVFLVKNNKLYFTKTNYDLNRIKDSVISLLKTNLKKECNYGEKGLVYAVSRPSFDKTKSFALIQYNLFNCKGEGNFDVKLYRKISENWIEIATVLSKRRQTICFMPSRIVK